MDKNKAVLVVEALEKSVRQRPFMFFSTESFAIVNFLSGFNSACSLFGLKTPSGEGSQIYKEVVEEHGWEWSAGGPWHEMYKKGMENTGIIDKVLAIEIETWKRLYQIEDN